MGPYISRLKDPLIEQFNLLVQPNDIQIQVYKTFLLYLPYQKFGLFPFFRMTAQQNIYSSKDLQLLARATAAIGFSLEGDIRKCFEKRVTAVNKEAGIIAHTRRRNAENLLRYFIYEPVSLALRGSEDEELNEQ